MENLIVFVYAFASVLDVPILVYHKIHNIFGQYTQTEYGMEYDLRTPNTQ